MVTFWHRCLINAFLKGIFTHKSDFTLGLQVYNTNTFLFTKMKLLIAKSQSEIGRVNRPLGGITLAKVFLAKTSITVTVLAHRYLNSLLTSATLCAAKQREMTLLSLHPRWPRQVRRVYSRCDTHRDSSNLLRSLCLYRWQFNQGILKGEVSLYHWPPVDWFGISCITTDIICFYVQNRLIQTSLTGGQ